MKQRGKPLQKTERKHKSRVERQAFYVGGRGDGSVETDQHFLKSLQASHSHLSLRNFIKL